MKQIPIHRGGKPQNLVCWLEKRCQRCGVKQPIHQFNRSSRKFDGHNSRCGSCERTRHSADYVRRKDAITADNKRRRDEDRFQALRHYSGGEPRCQCCDEWRVEFLTFDHVKGGGANHRRSLGGNGAFYSWLRRNNYPSDIRVLCFNCNCSIGFLGYCPHERERIQWATPANGAVLKFEAITG